MALVALPAVVLTVLLAITCLPDASILAHIYDPIATIVSIVSISIHVDAIVVATHVHAIVIAIQFIAGLIFVANTHMRGYIQVLMIAAVVPGIRDTLIGLLLVLVDADAGHFILIFMHTAHVQVGVLFVQT